MSLFLWGYTAWLYYVALFVNLLSYVEEFALLWLLPKWTPNVRGLYWVLRQRGSGS